MTYLKAIIRIIHNIVDYMAIREKLSHNKYYGIVHGNENSKVYGIGAVKVYCKPEHVNELIRKLKAIEINVDRSNEL